MAESQSLIERFGSVALTVVATLIVGIGRWLISLANRIAVLEQHNKDRPEYVSRPEFDALLRTISMGFDSLKEEFMYLRNRIDALHTA